MKTRILVALLITSVLGNAQARLEVDRLFSDNMVLQQKMSVPVWGQASSGKLISVRFSNQSHKVKVDKDGRWMVRLDPMEASKEGRNLSIKGDGSEIVLKNVLVGEVWVGSGQSNMAFTLSQAEDGKAALPLATHPLIRMFTKPVRKKAREAWVSCSPETVKDFSAVAYFFAKDLHEKDGIPVGVVVRAVGGTTIQRWVAAEASRQNELIKSRMAEAEKYEDDFVRFEKEKGKYDKRNKPDAGTAAWLLKMSNLSNYRVGGQGGLYNRMIRPLQPMAIRGVIWYQGEFNNRPGQAFDYREWQSTLVNSWRKDWGQGDFPFLFVQMQVLGNATTTLLRESQTTTLRRCPNTGMAVICDQSIGLHPPNKQIAGVRLASAARNLIGGNSNVVSGPLLRNMRQEGDRLILSFEDVGTGISVIGEGLKGFFICGEDQRFELAQAQQTGPGQITVWSARIKKPTAVRYAWLNDPRELMTVFDSEGLPASPFRTDTFSNTDSLHLLFPKAPKKGKKKSSR